MGTWNVGLFDNDAALDLRVAFEDALQKGLSVDEATEIVFMDLEDEFDDYDSGPTMRLALAALQIEKNALSPPTKGEALGIIDSGAGLEPWEGSPKREERRKVLKEFRAKLLTN